jgi:formate dehydrogenase major subunit
MDIVFSDRFPTTSGLGKFVPANVLPPDERPDAEYPFVLSTGRQLEHWHTGAMTRRASVLDAVEPEPTVQMHPADVARFNIEPGDQVRVTSRRGSIVIRVRAEGMVQQGVVFIPFAYVEAAANLLTNPKLDPFGKIPEFKYCAVKIEPVKRSRLQAAE